MNMISTPPDWIHVPAIPVSGRFAEYPSPLIDGIEEQIDAAFREFEKGLE